MVGERSSFRFRDWYSCPECGERDIGSLAHGTELVLECYNCGLVAQFGIGRDISVDGIDFDAIEEMADRFEETPP